MKFLFFRKKFTRFSKNYVKFILEGKWTFGIISYTLSHAKSNGSINFVLSLKLGSLSIFRRPPKTLYFICNSFSLHSTENMITDSSIPWKNKPFLFKSFFSQVNNKKKYLWAIVAFNFISLLICMFNYIYLNWWNKELTRLQSDTYFFLVRKLIHVFSCWGLS